MGIIENTPFIVLLIPIISGLVGWFTNWIAVKAMLYPVKFVGIGPIGWQGIMPKETEKLSRSFSELIADKLVPVDSLFSDIDLTDNEEIEPVIQKMKQQAIDQFAQELAPDKWERANDKLKDYIGTMIERSVRKVIENIVKKMSSEAKDLIDLDKVVRDAMMEDRGLLGRVLLEVAEPEFRFIERSGWWFGLLFGIVQMIVWVSFPNQWILPIAGFFVGYVTNFLALHFIFEPREPMHIGPFKFQGIFIKRQMEVAEKFSSIIADSVLTAERLMKEITEGPSKEPVLAIIEGEVQDNFSQYEKDPMVGMLVSKEKIAEARADVGSRLRESDLQKDSPISAFASQTGRIKKEMQKNLGELDSEEFGGVLRPVFKEDEWKLILAGGVLGAIAGVLQLVFLFADYIN